MSGSPDRLDERQVNHRAQWERKKTIRLLYRDFHRRLLENCPEGRVLDIGGDANQAIPTLLFATPAARLRTEARIPSLRVVSVRWLSLFAYPMSGGFQSWSLLPAALVGPLLALEEKVPEALRKQFAFRMMVVIERL